MSTISLKTAYAEKCPCWTKNIAQQSISPRDPAADPKYQTYYANKPTLILHSYGYANPSGREQAMRWNRETNTNAIAHFAISALSDLDELPEAGAYQTLRLDMMGWHVGSQGNPLFIGAEMAESDAIKYRGSTDRFDVLDRAKALHHCKVAYNNAVKLFAEICADKDIDPLGYRSIDGKLFPNVMGHCEWNRLRGVAGHTDPEHYWSQLGTNYTMDGFRADVAAKMQENAAHYAEFDAEYDEEPTSDSIPFSDVPQDAWYGNALKWALKNKIVLPSSGPFYPDQPLTKATAIVLLRRLANAIGKGGV